MRWLLVLLLCPTLAWANAKPCERVITMDTPTVLERIALQPLRGVTLRLPIELSPQAFYHISDASWLNYQEAPRQNLVAVAFNDLKRQSFEQDVDLVISDQGLSFVLTFGIVKPTEQKAAGKTSTAGSALGPTGAGTSVSADGDAVDAKTA
ncbi:MAG: hypothetical protein P8176_13340 [Gammaproteobacteria bacterium]